MIYQNLLVISVFILAYSLVSKRLERTQFSGALLAIAVGLLASSAVLNILNIDTKAESYKFIAEITLALVLFTDASNANLKVLKSNIALPSRLLLIGLPLTILLGILASFLLFDGFSIIEAGILATLLAPTDAALGKAVVTNERVPSKIREALNIESGLNDGICVPILFLLIALFETENSAGASTLLGVTLFLKEIGIGLGVGLFITYSTVKIWRFTALKGWITESWKTVIVIMLAFTCFALAQISGGSGFIACFTGGLLYGAMHKKHQNAELLEDAEGIADSLTMVTWIIFGGIIILLYLPQFTWSAIIYAILSLTVIRIIPVLLSLIKTELKFKEKLFIGWFGPRGLASIVFAIIVLDLPLPHKETIILTAVCTILLSIILHGLSAIPFVKLLSRK